MLFANIYWVGWLWFAILTFSWFYYKNSASFNSCWAIVSCRIHLIKAVCVAVWIEGLDYRRYWWTSAQPLSRRLVLVDDWCAVNTVSRYLFSVHYRVLFQILPVTFADRYRYVYAKAIVISNLFHCSTSELWEINANFLYATACFYHHFSHDSLVKKWLHVRECPYYLVKTAKIYCHTQIRLN